MHIAAESPESLRRLPVCRHDVPALEWVQINYFVAAAVYMLFEKWEF